MVTRHRGSTNGTGDGNDRASLLPVLDKAAVSKNGSTGTKRILSYAIMAALAVVAYKIADPHSWSNLNSSSNYYSSLVSRAAADPRDNRFQQRGLEDYHDLCIVGAGLSGAVIAERYANVRGQTSLILERRDHIGGNCYDYIDEETGIRVSKYGAHLFHTNYKRVWEYIQKWSYWTKYEHEVVAFIDGKHVPVPVNIDTVNALFGLKIKDSKEMDKWLKSEQVKPAHGGEPQNWEEMAKSRVGERLYELIFHPYTIKQWAKEPRDLGPEVTARIPVFNNHDPRYFPDPYQALPTNGYTAVFEKMFDNPFITVMTNTDFFEVRSKLKCGKLYYTGPVDRYFADQGLKTLEYRSLDFERKVVKDIDFFQPKGVVNHPNASLPYTRIVEYKHFLDQKSDHTVLFYEYSKGKPRANWLLITCLIR
jgi:UDP-galactopyranose mutase